MKTSTLSAFCLSALLAVSATAQEKAPPLPAMGADLAQTSVSGISSGGFMAAQLATAYSGRFKGVGVIAAGPFYCAGTYPVLSMQENATTTCMSPSSAAVAASARASWKKAREFAQAGRIDPVANLQLQRVYIFSGANDSTVKTMVVDEVETYYLLAGVPKDRIRYQQHGQAGHAIATGNPGHLPCSATGSPYINNCGFNQSHELLRHIYPEKSQPANTAEPQGELLRFDQGEFIKGSRTSMDNDAWVYVPRVCRANACPVHVAFHGCQQGASVIGSRFYREVGYNEFADTNGIIVLYPQAHRSDGIPPNPRGCWDFWGYSSENQHQPNFFSKDAPQMSAIVAMIDRLGQKP